MIRHLILHNKAFNIAKNPKYDGYQRRIGYTVSEFFDKKTSATRGNKSAGSGIKKRIAQTIY